MDPLITVIIPAYNVEPYIEKCILSVVNQSYNRLEIIVVDDGSEKTCAELCDMIADERTKVYHIENSGVSAARNKGIEESSGEYTP